MFMLRTLTVRPSSGSRLKSPWQHQPGFQKGSFAKPRASSRSTSRRFEMHGTNTSAAEVTHVSKHGFWLLLGNEELLLPFESFPWFRQATIEQLSQVEWPSKNHVYWPQLDVDLAVESIRNPAAFPLVSRAVA